MNPLPPQAYTKDTMLKAYAWVMNQPAAIKELATTPDILVSLYLKAQRDGLDSLERPSIQNFRDELKSLAGMMTHLSSDGGQQSVSAQSFQTTTVSSVSSARSTTVAPQTQTAGMNQTTQQPSMASQATLSVDPLFTPQAQVYPHHAESPTAATAPREATQAQSLSRETHTLPQQTLLSVELDERSLALIREVKSKLNLSSDMEALKALIQIGHNSLKNCLPQESSTK